MNSNKDFCRNVCALMAKLNKALYIQHSLQFMWQKVWGYLKTTDVSISTFFFFTLRRPSSIRFWLIMRAEGVYCFILSCLSTASVIIFIPASYNIGQNVLRILHLLTHRTPIPLWTLHSPNQPMLFTKEQKSDFIIAFFWVEGVGDMTTYIFFLAFLYNIGGSKRQPEVAP